MRKIFCDICEKEIPDTLSMNILNLSEGEDIFFNDTLNFRKEICKNCSEQIVNFVNSLKKKS